ncbi:hypothetical protein GGE08_002698 [Muricauda sp. ARW1Y1]|jgi:hypothetical protein|nr:hypothetical protein [Muricauda sp. ARW1Y1]
MKSTQYHYLMKRVYVTICFMVNNENFFTQMKSEHTEDGSMSGKIYFDQNYKEINIGS